MTNGMVVLADNHFAYPVISLNVGVKKKIISKMNYNVDLLENQEYNINNYITIL